MAWRRAAASKSKPSFLGRVRSVTQCLALHFNEALLAVMWPPYFIRGQLNPVVIGLTASLDHSEVFRACPGLWSLSPSPGSTSRHAPAYTTCAIHSAIAPRRRRIDARIGHAPWSRTLGRPKAKFRFRRIRRPFASAPSTTRRTAST